MSRLLDLDNRGSDQEFLEAREDRRTFLSAASNSELLAQEQDFQVYLIERLPNNAQDVEQEDNELVKRIPEHE